MLSWSSWGMEGKNRHNSTAIRRIRVPIYLMSVQSVQNESCFPTSMTSCFPKEPTSARGLWGHTCLPSALHSSAMVPAWSLLYSHLHPLLCDFQDESTELSGPGSPLRGYTGSIAGSPNSPCSCATEWEWLDANSSPMLGTQSRDLLMQQQREIHVLLCSKRPYWTHRVAEPLWDGVEGRIGKSGHFGEFTLK